MPPHEASVHGAVQSDQEEKKTLQGAYRAVAGIANSVTASSPRVLALECWTKFPCNIPGVRRRHSPSQRHPSSPHHHPSREGETTKEPKEHPYNRNRTPQCKTGSDIVEFSCVSGSAKPRSKCCSHGNLLLFGLQGSRLNICYSNQDLHWGALDAGSHLALHSRRPTLSYSPYGD